MIIIEKISFITHIITFLIPSLINPGIPERKYYRKRFEREYNGDISKIKICDKCNITILKSLQISHCIFCNICIKNLDHHCPWIGKCVGKYTKIPFYFFLIGLIFYIISNIIIFITFIHNFFQPNKI